MKPGDVVVYRERAGCYEDDTIRRATIVDVDASHVACIRGEVVSWDAIASQSFLVRVSDIVRVDETQHGWTGDHSSRAAWST